MASILVYIHTEGDRPTTAALETLGEGRRIASALGATVYAMVQLSEADDGTLSGPAHTEIVTTLGRYGADKAVIAPGNGARGPALWASHGTALHTAFDYLQPMLVLFAADAAGRDMAPRLAARTGAVFCAEPSVERGPRGEIVFSRTVYGAAFRRRLAADDLDRAVVATLTPGSYRPAEGTDDAEVLFLEVPSEHTSTVEYLDSVADPGAALDTARVVVTAGGGVRDEATYKLVRELADALGGEVAATQAVCARGLAPAERQVGIGARSVAPVLYIACAASGSSAHLGAVSGDAEIIAIDINPNAPIFRAASYGIVGDLADILPDLIAAVREHNPVAATS